MKPKKMRVAVHLDADVYAKIAALAKRDGRSVSNLIARMMGVVMELPFDLEVPLVEDNLPLSVRAVMRYRDPYAHAATLHDEPPVKP
jgi:methylaspartate ammonia-lyase